MASYLERSAKYQIGKDDIDKKNDGFIQNNRTAPRQHDVESWVKESELLEADDIILLPDALDIDEIELFDKLPSEGSGSSVYQSNVAGECLRAEEFNASDIHKVPSWTISDFINALCHEDQPAIQEQPHTELNTAESHVAVEKESVDAESWYDGCVVPSCQRTCFKGENTKDVCIPKTDANSNQVSSAGSPPVCEQPRSGYGDIQGVLPLEQPLNDSHLPVIVGEEVVTEKKDVKDKEKALTDSHLLVPSAENITRDSVGEEVLTEKKDVKDEEKALTDSHLPVASVENITLDSVGEEVVTEKKDVKDKEKALTDSHLPVASVENITRDSVGEKGLTEKKDIEDNEITNSEVNNL